MASWKILVFGLILSSLALNSSTSAQRVKRFSDKHLNQNFMNIQDKFESIDKKMEQLESKGNYTFDVHEIIANITHLIVQLNNENAKKFEEKFENIEENFKNIERNFKKMEKFEEKLNNTEKFELNFKNIDENFKKMEKFEENFKNIEGNFKNIDKSLKKNEKCEEKLNKMELILFQLNNASDVCGGMTSLCTCAHNATTMPVKANSEPTDFRNTSVKNEEKALNACHTNPCLHGGRCRLSSTGSGYECECPKFRSGSRCENDECSAEKRCFRYKDTLYVVIETRLTWAEAKVNCEGLNMTLAMPKDEERTLFLINQLRPIYTTYPLYRLWIGLKRDEGMSKGQWEWVDGSALGEYTGGNKDMKSETGSSFGLLYVGGDGSWMWLRSSATTQYYSICESRFSTN